MRASLDELTFRPEEGREGVLCVVGAGGPGEEYRSKGLEECAVRSAEWLER